VLVRDGYAGYQHLQAVHAWCGAHLLRDLRSISDADPDGQVWATAMADTLLVQSYLDTAAKSGLDKLYVLRQLFTTGAWLPPALTPAE
jgi:transposase